MKLSNIYGKKTVTTEVPAYFYVVGYETGSHPGEIELISNIFTTFKRAAEYCEQNKKDYYLQRLYIFEQELGRVWTI